LHFAVAFSGAAAFDLVVGAAGAGGAGFSVVGAVLGAGD